MQRAGGRALEELAPRPRADQRREGSEEGSEESDHEPQGRRQRAPDHQKACPTANCTTTRRQNVAGRGGAYVMSAPVVLSVSFLRLLFVVLRK